MAEELEVGELVRSGVVKRLESRYRPGERVGWVKTKNRGYWRHGLEMESMRSRPVVQQ